jgi:LL-diaminopimelate aminotransferase
MNIRPAERISKIKPYFFADLETRIDKLKEEGLDIIRLDMGSPDLPPADPIIDALTKAARRPDVHGYGPSGGSISLKIAMAEYYKRRFGVNLNPSSDVLGLIGSKEGVFNLSQVFLNPGDLVLIPDPCYPVYAMGAMIAHAQVYYMPLLAENGFLPNLEAIPEEIAHKAKLMWLNYPNNPTGAVAPYDFYERVVSFAEKNEIIIAHDAPYVDVCFDGYQAPSLLELPGAKDVVIEFNSLSKTYNMAGWRLGMAVGNPHLVKYLRVYKSQIDSSHFRPMMLAAEAALNGDQTWIKDRNLIYQKRRDLIVQTLLSLGFQLSVPKAALYVWAHLPEYWTDGFDFCETLLHQTGVSITPGGVYGPSGAGYVRVSLVTPEARLALAMERIKEWIREKV